MITRRSMLSMLSAGIASVAVSTRLAASELKVVGWYDPITAHRLRYQEAQMAYNEWMTRVFEETARQLAHS